jgi:diguanylate cyclase (GGDEF)-like protein
MRKRLSIKGIFAAWQNLSLVLLFILILLGATTLSENSSHTKSSLLFGQKVLTNEIAALGRDDLELANIQYRGKSTQLIIDYDKLLAADGLDVSGMFLDYGEEYAADLEALKARISAFNQAAEAWYDAEEKDRRVLKEREERMQSDRYALLSQLDTMLFRNIGYDAQRYDIQKILIYAALLLGLLIFGLFVVRFRTIFRDIHSLYSVETKGDEYKIVTEEIDVISKRMGRKTPASDNPALVDPITEISNYKGLIHAFSNRKSKDGAPVSICVFDIDGFKELDRQYPKSFTQQVLKKVAFMLSLYEQHTDILARTDYSQFTMVLSRNNVEQALEECERIRKSIEETTFKIPKGNAIKITISGGLTTKNMTASLEETVEAARDILAKAKTIGNNSIKQAKDVVSV